METQDRTLEWVKSEEGEPSGKFQKMFLEFQIKLVPEVKGLTGAIQPPFLFD